jgi:hypothetical protein
MGFIGFNAGFLLLLLFLTVLQEACSCNVMEGKQGKRKEEGIV